jgi:putative addiction module component (TIGR02574 family)
MTQPVHIVENAALALHQSARAQLVLKLLDSLDQRPGAAPAAVEAAWIAEANRRYEAYLRGEEESISAEQLFADFEAEDR